MRAKKKDAADELAERMLAVLEEQRGLGGESYPLTLRRLAELADPQAASKQVAKAAGKGPFKGRALVPGKKNLAGPVVLSGDEEVLAASPLLLEFLLGVACTPKKPTVAVAALKKKVGSELQEIFAAALARRIRENTLPQGVECITVKKAQHLHPVNLPLPKKPEEALAEKLLRVLDTQRQLGADSYPLTLRRLAELTDPQANSKLVEKAIGKEPFKGGALVPGNKNLTAPVAVKGDAATLAASPLLLEYLLKSKRKPGQQTAFPAASLVGKKSDLYDPFNGSVCRGVESGSLPPTVGWLWVSKKLHIFLLEDVQRARREEHRPAPPPAPAAPPADFARVFDDAFQWINRQRGAHNFVSLVELRRALPLARDQFDAELRKLRVAGLYTLSGAEGRHGLTPEDREAGIREDGSLLLYVSRKLQ